MNKVRSTLSILALLVFTFTCASISQAQSRTWVSGVGDDLNPCSRTAPCKTFSRAHTVTQPNGEVNVLDAGGYGAVTITKNITIDGGERYSSILASGTTGIIVNIAGGHVTLRNLFINGAGTGLDGIRIAQAASVNVSNVKIINFTDKGIEWSPSTADGTLTVRNGTFTGCVGGGISVVNIAGFGRASIQDSTFHRGAFGVRAGGLSVVTVTNSIATATTDGFLANSGSAQMNLDSCVSTHNTNGAKVDLGAAMRISKCQISNNVTKGLSIVSGVIESYGTNMIRGNPSSDAPTPVAEG